MREFQFIYSKWQPSGFNGNFKLQRLLLLNLIVTNLALTILNRSSAICSVYFAIHWVTGLLSTLDKRFQNSKTLVGRERLLTNIFAMVLLPPLIEIWFQRLCPLKLRLFLYKLKQYVPTLNNGNIKLANCGSNFKKVN